jgi:hypothetical protein
MTTKELVHEVCPTIGKLGAAWYFDPATLEAGKSLGLDGLRFYFLGRGGVLGDVEWPVVHAAFGYFKPSLVDKMWTSAKQLVAPRQAARAHLASCAEFGRSHTGGIAGLGAYCEAAEAVIAEALRDCAGLSLFAGVASEALPADMEGRAMVVTAVLRELRGSAHLISVVASGLATPVAHRIARPDAMTMFGWAEGEVPEPTDADRAALEAAERLTDQLTQRYYGVLDAEGAEALRGGLSQLAAAIG